MPRLVFSYAIKLIPGESIHHPTQEFIGDWLKRIFMGLVGSFLQMGITAHLSFNL